MAADLDVVGARLGDAGRDGADTQRRDELHADARARADGPQVGDQLREILDRIDVVVRRRADQALPGLRAAQPGDERRDLPGGQLAALAGLGALGDLDLELLGASEVGGRDTEPGTGHLFDGAVMPVAVLVLHVPRRVLAALAGVAGHAQAAQADGEGLVRLGRQGAEGHGGTHEPPQDVGRRLDLGERDRGFPAAAGEAGRARSPAARESASR